jgi:hypothetical protein
LRPFRSRIAMRPRPFPKFSTTSVLKFSTTSNSAGNGYNSGFQHQGPWTTTKVGGPLQFSLL